MILLLWTNPLTNQVTNSLAACRLKSMRVGCKFEGISDELPLHENLKRYLMINLLVKLDRSELKDFEVVYFENKSYFMTYGNTFIENDNNSIDYGMRLKAYIRVIIEEYKVSFFDEYKYFAMDAREVKINTSSKNKTIHNLLYGNIVPLILNTWKIRESILDTLKSKYWNETFPEYITSNRSKTDFKFYRKISYEENQYVDTSRIFGSLHPDYENKSWIGIFMALKRDKNIWNALFNGNTKELYSNEINSFGSISFKNYDGEYYVDSGSHRTTLAIILGLDTIGPVPVQNWTKDYEFESCFNTLNEFGFEVTFSKNIEVNIEKWETFIITVDHIKYELFGLEKIQRFIEEYKMYILLKQSNFVKRYFERKTITQMQYKEIFDMFLASQN